MVDVIATVPIILTSLLTPKPPLSGPQPSSCCARQVMTLDPPCTSTDCFYPAVVYLTVLLSNSPAIKGLFTNPTISFPGTANKQKPN